MCMLAVYRIQIRIRIHQIQMFLGLPDPDPLVRGMDPELAPDPDPSIILLSSSKTSKKNLDFYCFVTSFELFIFENDINVPSKSNKKKNLLTKNYFFVGVLKVNDENRWIQIRIRIRIWIQ